MDGSECEGYSKFLDAFKPLVNELADAGWTRSESRHRLVTLYPSIPRHYLDRALSQYPQRFVHPGEESLNSTLLASGVWLALNHLLDLGEDRRFIAVSGDPAIVQDISRIFEAAGATEEQTAALLGKVGATLSFLTEFPQTSITSAEYEAFRNELPGDLLEMSRLVRSNWPASARSLSSQFGEGSWSRALVSIGLAPSKRYGPDGTDRVPDFTQDRFRSAIADFLTYCIRNNRKPLALLYGRWSSDVARHTTPRPTLAALRNRFGSWHKALVHGRRLINEEAPGRCDPRYEENWVGPWGNGESASGAQGPGSWSPQHWIDRGIGVVEHVGGEATGDETAWRSLIEEIGQAIKELPWKHFLTVDYATGNTGGDSPYAQAFTGPGGVSVSLVSEHFLPAIMWPLDEEYLKEAGWTPPNPHRWHWEQSQLALNEAAGLLVDALRYGRGCSDPYRFRWGSGAIYDLGRSATAPTL
ncbi:TY-Chap domain-containing protein [Rothia uropygialis]|uniref:TY-Chap domain-containing protein n=1 Tax=Kocuria sp. 36 TaxID=1415402 RepID=UPI00101DBD74|nr:hypothetical protein [Kocuria sp. 36]